MDGHLGVCKNPVALVSLGPTWDTVSFLFKKMASIMLSPKVPIAYAQMQIVGFLAFFRKDFFKKSRHTVISVVLNGSQFFFYHYYSGFLIVNDC